MYDNNDLFLFLRGPWDLEINTNVLIFERAATTFFHPHPEVEALRCGLAAKLRQCYQELCHSREGNSSFNSKIRLNHYFFSCGYKN